MITHYLRTKMTIALPRAQVFDFFSCAENLGRITPPDMQFHIVTPLPIHMHRGAIIDYRIQLRGLPMAWRTEITQWEPPCRFQDLQVRGPYARWLHTHEFREVEGGTEIEDHVEYRLPLSPLGDIAYPIVRRQLDGIFRHRQHAVRRLLLEAVPA